MSKKEKPMYLCDPHKNPTCRKTICKLLGRGMGGMACELTSYPEYKRDGTEPVYPLKRTVSAR